MLTQSVPSPKALSGFVVEDIKLIPDPDLPHAFFILMRSQTKWEPVVEKLKAEYPDSQLVRSDNYLVAAIVVKDEDLVIRFSIGPGIKGPETIETTKFSQIESDYCVVLVSVRSRNQTTAN